MGENQFAAAPVAVYGVVLLAAGCAYYVMAQVLLASHAQDSLLARALGRDFKGRVSIVIYAVAIAAAFRLPWLSGLLYGLVAVIWVVPDSRFERLVGSKA
jgi:uncharacterized membrane protein